MKYNPNKKYLEKYADLLVNFALGGGKGIKKGDVVYLVCYESAKPLLVELRRAILKSGGHIISNYKPDDDSIAGINLSRDFYLLAEDHQLDFFPSKYLRGLLNQMDHMLYIDSETDKQALKGIDPKKIMRARVSHKPFMDWRDEKENQGKFSWTIAIYGTEAMAKEAKMSLKEYWDQIIKACYLDKKNVIGEWKTVFNKINILKNKLNSLKIDKLNIKGPDVDLQIKLGQKRRWVGGRGANIPSFEIFTSPDWRGTNGWIRFNQPIYAHGNLITGVKLIFKEGKIIKSSADKNENVLKEIIKVKNANKIGEFSLTDKRLSRISKFMADGLYDENVSGPHGNTHIAIGKAYGECYDGDPRKMKREDWDKLGFNDSAIHIDIISTAPRVVTIFSKSGKEKIIYKNGQFTI